MGRNNSGFVSQSRFATVPGVHLQRSVFDKSAPYKTAFDSGYLIPFFTREILPGDVMDARFGFVCRLATPQFPYMDNVYLDFHFFFCPDRLGWDNFERFHGAQDDPGDSTNFLYPQLDDATYAAGFGQDTVFDYFGLPTKVASIPQVDMPTCMPLRHYYRIWNEWFRDENLQNSLVEDTSDGPDTTAYTLLKRGRKKDYFFSGLTSPQKGTAVVMPLGTSAPVIADGLGTPFAVASGASGDRFQAFAAANAVAYTGGATTGNLHFGSQTGLIADLNAATAASFEAWRHAAALQSILERDARVGTRYTENLLGRWGIQAQDARLQRPEFINSGTALINVNPIAQTSASATTPQGNLSAFAVASGSVGFNKSFPEHGWVIGLVSVRADMTYQQGLPRQWSRRSRFDFYMPELAPLGEQPIYNKEIFMNADANDNLAWGYKEAWSEYKFSPGIVTGAFRSNHSASLDAWHLAIDFPSLPTLAGNIEEDPPIDRIIAVPGEKQFIFESFARVKHTIAMPVNNVPWSLSRF